MLRRRAAGSDVEAVEVVPAVLPRGPEQVVVAVDDGVLGEERGEVHAPRQHLVHGLAQWRVVGLDAGAEPVGDPRRRPSTRNFSKFHWTSPALPVGVGRGRERLVERVPIRRR